MSREILEHAKEGPWHAFMRRVALKAWPSSQLGLFDAQEMIRAIFKNLAREVEARGRVEVPGFGVFRICTRKARRIVGFDGQPIQLPERREVVFKASKNWGAP